MTKTLTGFHQPPKQANDTGIHYGYVAFQDINLQGSVGLEYKVQPDTSPYYQKLPCRELIPFTNISVAEINEEIVRSKDYRRPNQPPIKWVNKTAGECVREMVGAYENWVFVELTDLNGLDYDSEAFPVFQTIQPFAYSLKSLLDELEWGATERIAQDAPYEVTYGGETILLNPLPPHLKDIALKTRDKMILSARKATEMGDEIVAKTTQQMTQFFATGNGKRMSDPLDRIIFEEFEKDIPRLMDQNAANPTQATEGILTRLADLIAGKPAQTDASATLDKELAEIRDLKARLEAALAEASAPKATTPIADAPSVTIGDTVVVDGQEATVTGKPFGKITVTFADGSAKTVKKDELE